MSSHKTLGSLGIFLLVLSFLAAPSYGAVSTLNPDTVATNPDVTCDVGCQVDQACPCVDPWANHGEYVKCVSQKVKELYGDGLLTEEDGEAIISNRAKGDCGKAPKGQQNMKK